MNPERHETTPTAADRPPFKIGPPSRAAIARPVRVTDIKEEAEHVLRITLESPDGRDLPPWTPGAHVQLLVGDYDRRYSLCGDPNDRGRYQLCILKEENGSGGSKYVHENLHLHDMVRIRGPKNHFRMDEGASSYLLIAGGIGITPIVAMADRLKELGKPYNVHYVGRAAVSMALRERLRRDHGQNVVFYPGAEGERMNLRDLTAQTAAEHIYACGPERLLSELVALSESRPENTLHIEHFSGTQRNLDTSHDQAFEIELRDSQITLQVPADKSVLDVLEAAGIDVACDCREGLCGSCEVQVNEGDIEHRDRVLSQTERARNTKMITCCSRAMGKKLTLAL